LFAAIIAQRIFYGNAPASISFTDNDELEHALALAEE
jgi:hypothetical protein